jgi:xanthine dehydrogenase accessory factor
VVATQGRRDVQALRLALALNACQVSFVASARKAQVLKDSLVAAGADAGAVAAIVAPAGYPMAATTPQEIALSVLAAIVSHRRSAAAAVGGPAPATAAVAADVALEAAVDAADVDAALAAPVVPLESRCGGPGAELAVAPPPAPSSCCGG